VQGRESLHGAVVGPERHYLIAPPVEDQLPEDGQLDDTGPGPARIIAAEHRYDQPRFPAIDSAEVHVEVRFREVGRMTRPRIEEDRKTASLELVGDQGDQISLLTSQ
jgi:hypothetical protein